MRREKLPESTIQARLAQAGGWNYVDGRLQKKYRFKRFTQSIDFVTRLARVAEEELNHHPDIFISFNQVTLYLMTHAVKGITDFDFALAGKADELAAAVMGG